MKNIYDVIVVGLGAVGSFTIFQLSKSNKKILGLDQYSPPHTLGSSHGETRITRQAIGEGASYIPIVLRSNEIWAELEKLAGANLYKPCGGLIYGSLDSKVINHGCSDFMNNTISLAKEFNIEHKLFNSRELKDNFPQFEFSPEEIGYYEPKAGYLIPEKCIQIQLELAKQNGSVILPNTPIKSFETKNGLVILETDNEEFYAEQVIICSGNWMSSLLKMQTANIFQVTRQILYWFEGKLPINNYYEDKMPIFIKIGNQLEDSFYGFPAVQGMTPGIKLATEQSISSKTPEEVDLVVSADEINKFYESFNKSIKIKNNCIKSHVCCYTTTPDSGFVIDYLPNQPQVLIASCCSGHGFKHSAAIGEILAEISLLGKSKISIKDFSLSRFNNFTNSN